MPSLEIDPTLHKPLEMEEKDEITTALDGKEDVQMQTQKSSKQEDDDVKTNFDTENADCIATSILKNADSQKEDGDEVKMRSNKEIEEDVKMKSNTQAEEDVKIMSQSETDADTSLETLGEMATEQDSISSSTNE